MNNGRDGKVRSVGISFKIMVENDEKVYHEDFEWKHSVVERPARAVVKLMNIEDTSLIEDMEKVQGLVKEILNNNKTRSALDKQENLDVSEADGPIADDAKTVKKETEEKSKEKKFKKSKKRKSEVERLLEDVKIKTTPEDLRKVLRSKKNYPLINKQADVVFSVQMDTVKSIHWPRRSRLGLLLQLFWTG